MRGPTWTNESLLDLEDLLAAGATDQAVARRLGRTVTAVRVARKRYGVPCRRRLIMTQRGVARLMGIGGGKTVSRWIQEGGLRSRPGASLGNGRERYVTREQLLAFLEDPAHWHIWSPERITDPGLRAWAADERTAVYLRPGEVGRRLHVQHRTVNTWIRIGLLPAQKWGNWWVRESDLESFIPPSERSKHGMVARRWTRAELLTLRRLRDEGRIWREIAASLPGRSVAAVYGAWHNRQTGRLLWRAA